MGSREQIGWAEFCKAEVCILLFLCCSNLFRSWTIRCSHDMGQKWCADDSGWWLLWCWRFCRGIKKSNSVSWNVSLLLPCPPYSGCQLIREFCIFSNMRIITWHHNYYRWDVNVATDCCSEKVRIIFSALQSTICQIGDKGLMHQERCVTDHIIDIVRSLLHPHSMDMCLFDKQG